MLELVASMEFGIVTGVALPHLPEDLQPALAQTSQGASMTLSPRAEGGVIDLCPRAGLAAQVCPQMNGVAQKLVTLAPQMDAMDLARLKTHRCCACQTLQRLRVSK